MYKFRIIIRYEDEETYQDLIELARKLQLSFANNADREEIIIFLNDTNTLVSLAQCIHERIE